LRSSKNGWSELFRALTVSGWLPVMVPLALGLSIAGCETDTGTMGDARVTQAADGEITQPDFSDTRVDPRYLDEIEAIMADARVQEAMEYIEALEERSRQDLIDLTEIPASPFMEEERAAAYAEMLREAGADSVWLDGIGNVLALRRGIVGERTIALDGHLDTVFPPETDLTVQIRGDTLYAPGIGDDTRGLIVVRNVLEAMDAADIRTEDDLLFIGTVGEEGLGDLRGMKHLFEEGGPDIDVIHRGRWRR
jgi:tripeptide aminopeptidase